MRADVARGRIRFMLAGSTKARHMPPWSCPRGLEPDSVSGNYMCGPPLTSDKVPCISHIPCVVKKRVKPIRHPEI